MKTPRKATRELTRRLRGLTMIELTISLVIMSILSTAVYGLVAATAKTGSFLNAQTQGLAEMDLAIRRIVYNIRTAPTVPTWTKAGSYSVLAVTKSGVGTITYYVNSTGDLVEDDPRYDSNLMPNVLVHGIGSGGLSCNIVNASTTQLNTTVEVDLTLSAQRTIGRHVTVSLRDSN